MEEHDNNVIASVAFHVITTQVQEMRLCDLGRIREEFCENTRSLACTVCMHEFTKVLLYYFFNLVFYIM